MLFRQEFSLAARLVKKRSTPIKESGVRNIRQKMTVCVQLPVFAG